MWEKIKNIFSIIGASLSVCILTIIVTLLCRRKAVRPRSDGTDERDSRIQEGLDSSQERAERIEDGISKAEDGITRCEERLQRAEDILRRAIERSRQEKSDASDSCNNN